MYELEYVKKRKRKKAIAIVGGVCTVGVTALAIVAFLGRFVGTFTVSLNTDTVQLSLSEKESFENPTSYLRIDKLPKYEEMAYSSLPSEDVLDSEATDYLSGANRDKGKVVSLNYFKYTFYVRNVGTRPANYDLKITINESVAAKDGTGRKLDDTLRVLVYHDNEKRDARVGDVYARRAVENNYTEKGEVTAREFISARPSDRTESDEYPLADMFIDDRTVATYSVGNFVKGDTQKYTIVTWLEGNDLQSKTTDLAPEGATIKLGVTITAYEIER